MNKWIILCALFLAACSDPYAAYKESIRTERSDRNQEFLNAQNSPLGEEGKVGFSGLKFFEIDPAWRIEGAFKLHKRAVPFKLPKGDNDSTSMLDYGEVSFSIKGENYTLKVFKPMKTPLQLEQEEYLFIPFGDLTNGSETYENGRYVYPEINDNGSLLLDFNQTVNPYCAYHDKWTCTFPPIENQLNVEIKAGEKKYH